MLEVDDRPALAVGEGEELTVVFGPLASVVRWAAGRGGVGLTAGAEVTPPRWL